MLGKSFVSVVTDQRIHDTKAGSDRVKSITETITSFLKVPVHQLPAGQLRVHRFTLLLYSLHNSYI